MLCICNVQYIRQMSDKTRRCAVLQKIPNWKLWQEDRKCFKSMSPLPCVQWSYFPYTETRFCNLGKGRIKGILINKLSLEYIYRFPIMWNYERDINHKSYMKNTVEAQIPASIIQSEGLRETNMMQGGFNYVKTPLWKFFFFSVCHRAPLMNLCYSKWLWSGEPQNADSSICFSPVELMPW